MVRSTIIVRASDALPLAASVDDEQVGCLLVTGELTTDQPSHVDRADSTGAQTTSETRISTHNTQLRAKVFHRKWKIHSAVIFTSPSGIALR